MLFSESSDFRDVAVILNVRDSPLYSTSTGIPSVKRTLEPGVEVSFEYIKTGEPKIFFLIFPREPEYPLLSEYGDITDIPIVYSSELSIFKR